MEPKRILYIHGGILSRGGTESYIMNYYRHFDRSRMQIDFIVHGFEKGVYDDEIESMGGKLYHVAVKSKAPLQNSHQIRKILREHPYRLVHSHMDAMSYVPLKIAKSCGVPIRIAHSHNTQHLTNNPAKILMNEYARRRLPTVATNLFACTEKAGVWLFGEQNRNRLEIIPNAIETKAYVFDAQARERIRSQLRFSPQDIVLGHVGRFDYQKNHEFLVEIFAEVWHKDSRYKLVMVGDGRLKETIRKKVEDLGVREAVRFVPACAEVNQYYSAFDYFCLPSHFEGLGIVLIEAQTNGLSCLASEAVPHTADVTDNVEFLPLQREAWVKNILQKQLSIRLPQAEERVISAGYAISVQTQRLQQRYEDLLRQQEKKTR